MDDALLVRGVERFGDLPRDVSASAIAQRTALETIGERRSLDELQDERRLPPSTSSSAVDRADVRMIERRQQARFAREPGAALRIGGEVRGQNLDRDVATEPAVARAIDLAHAAGAERRDDRCRSRAARPPGRGWSAVAPSVTRAAGVSRNCPAAGS